jgi:hypothetical protein
MEVNRNAKTEEERREVVERLLAVWERLPEQRFCQLLRNIVPSHATQITDENLVLEAEAFAERACRVERCAICDVNPTGCPRHDRSKKR